MIKLQIASTGILIGLSLAGVKTAIATTVNTPFGLADDSCVHEIPKGSAIDVTSGDVIKAGSVVGHHDRCTTSPYAIRARHNASVDPAGGGWYAWSWANATTISGKTQFNRLNTSWYVPTNPSVPGADTSIEYYFSSLQNGGGCGNAARDLIIIQPVLQWGYDGHSGGQHWQTVSWAVWGCDASCLNCSIYYSPPEPATAGDYIYGYIWQEAANLDRWGIEIDNGTSGSSTSMQLNNIPNAWPKFNTAQGGVLEAYGSTGGGNLASCAKLSPDNYSLFSIDRITEAGPNWNSFNDVSASVTWTSGHGSQSPSCSWSQYTDAYGTSLYWSY